MDKLRQEQKKERLEKFLKGLKDDYGRDLPHLMNRVREAVEHGLTNSLLIDEVLSTYNGRVDNATTEEGRRIVYRLYSNYISTSDCEEVSNMFYDLRRIYEILTTISECVNE